MTEGCACATDLGIANPQKTLQAGLDDAEDERIKKLLAAQREKDRSATDALFGVSNSYGSGGNGPGVGGPGGAGGADDGTGGGTW